jgi:serine/threonine-protein kinase
MRTATRVGAVLSGYELGRVLASGSGGRVHLARQLGAGGRTVAIKRLAPGADPAVVARLRREGEILVSLDHPGIVRVYELVPDGDSLAIAMQYAVGGSLADRLEVHGPLSPAQVVGVAARCADALASAHRRGVLHRDIKPANILFTSDGEPLLSDFGVARWASAPGLTRGGASFGTAGYLAPEILDGAEPDVRADVYSLGVVCYHALAGAPPFRGATEAAVLRAADAGAFTPLLDVAPGVSPLLATVVERAMARDRGSRFVDAAALAAALRETGAAGAGAGLGASVGASPAFAGSESLGPVACVAVPSRQPEPAVPLGTSAFGPRPPRPAEPRAPRFRLPRVRLPRVRLRLPRPLLTGLAVPPARALLLAAVAAAGVALFLVTRPGPSAAQSGGGWACPAVGQMGCDMRATVSGNVVALRSGSGPVTRFALGQPGDVAVLGDWRCRGVQTPGLYRPATSQVYLFDGWAASNRSLKSSPPIATGVLDGRPVVVHSPGGCDHVEVRPN